MAERVRCEPCSPLRRRLRVAIERCHSVLETARPEPWKNRIDRQRLLKSAGLYATPYTMKGIGLTRASFV